MSKSDIKKTSIFDNLKKPISKPEWDAKHKDAAISHDQLESIYAASHEMPLDKEMLHKIVKARAKISAADESHNK